MNETTAERWVVISAATVAGVYGYRRLTEPAAAPVTVKKLAGVGELPPLGSFATAWGFTFLVIAVITQAAPGLGAAFAILIATGDLLTNSGSVFADIGKQQKPAAGQNTATETKVATGAAKTVHPLQPLPAFASPHGT